MDGSESQPVESGGGLEISLGQALDEPIVVSSTPGLRSQVLMASLLHFWPRGVGIWRGRLACLLGLHHRSGSSVAVLALKMVLLGSLRARAEVRRTGTAKQPPRKLSVRFY